MAKNCYKAISPIRSELTISASRTCVSHTGEYLSNGVSAPLCSKLIITSYLRKYVVVICNDCIGVVHTKKIVFVGDLNIYKEKCSVKP